MGNIRPGRETAMACGSRQNRRRTDKVGDPGENNETSESAERHTKESDRRDRRVQIHAQTDVQIHRDNT